MLPRFHVGEHLVAEAGRTCDLPDEVARHVQVLRMQPGGALHLFDGQGTEWLATVAAMERRRVSVVMGREVPVSRELPVQVTLAMGMPANDRMDALIEKAAELGVRRIQPLICERSVLRLERERAAKKVAHWQSVAIAACEQCGRAVVPRVEAVRSLVDWLGDLQGGAQPEVRKAVLSLRDARPLMAWASQKRDGAGGRDVGGEQGNGGSADGGSGGRPHYLFLSGPEGGLSLAEEEMALRGGWQAVTLGPRVLRADTAPLAALSVIGAMHEGGG